MSSRSARSVLAHDVRVKLRRPTLAGILCLLTFGIWGAVHHFRLTREVARFGRARGAMPFPFTPVNPGTSTLAWVAGLCSWYLLVGAAIAYGFELADGYEPTPDDVTLFASIVLLLAPLWLVASHTIERIRTVQHMAGVDGRHPSPGRGALLTSIFPPLGTWHAQRELNRAWQVYR
jgi:hypothetical protein